MKKLIKYIKGYTLETILSPLFIMGEVVMEVLIPIVLASLIDNGINKGDMDYVIKSGALMTVMALLSLTCGICSGVFSAKASAGFAKNLRKAIYHQIQDFSFENLDHFQTSSLITRLTMDVTQIQQAFQMLIRIFIRAPFMFIFALIMAIILNARLSIVFLVCIPILIIGLYLIITKAMPYFKEMFKKYDKLNSTVQENLIGIRVVKAFVREDYETEKFKEASSEVQEFSKKAQKIVVLNNPLMQFIMYGAIIAISWFGGKMIVNNVVINGKVLTSGQLTTFLSYVMQILMSLMMVSLVIVMLTMAKTAVNRVVEVLDEKSTLSNNMNPIMEVLNGDIDFKDVDFSYNNKSSDNVMHNLNFHIRSGETIGILGGTGSGKSTMVQLIPRLYDVTSGEVLVGGHNVKDYDLNVLRDNVSMVLQKNVLFSGTIKENLRWGNKNATDEEIIDACKKAQAHDFIMSFPNGYDTDLGQGGVNVSGGQKQRLCIARALLKKPQIIIFDDSTSAVDTKTDAMIRNELKKLKNVTKLIIAQRISSIEDADRIIVLDDGEIVDMGSHEELLKKSEIYKEVYYSQMKGSEQ